MKAVFVDTFFLLAALNPADSNHERALAWSDTYEGPMLTTAWVLTEVADAFVAMSDEDLAEAVTADHHFQQAGFVALLGSHT